MVQDINIKMEERETKPALLRGWRRKCPSCGTGNLMNGFLKVHDACTVCGEELHHQRADDGPAYVTIIVCAHILAPIMVHIFDKYEPNSTYLTIVFCLIYVVMALYLLPRIKGAFVGLQWAKRMHGFSAKQS